MLSTSRRLRGGDDGFALVLVALVLIVLLVFTAIVVDIGGVYAKRRDDQNAADVAALAAVHELERPIDESAMVATVKQQAHTALGTTLSDAEWDSCPPGGNDPGEDPGVLVNQIATASCISYNPVRVRVRLPDQFLDTTFGAVVGRDSIRHSAFAIAGLEPEGFGGVLPFAVTGASAAGGLGCLKSNSNGQASALCESTTGNFGYLDFSHYGPGGGNPDLGTTQSCGSGETGPRIEANTAMGVDHELSLEATVHVPSVADTDACPTLTETPDAAWTETGNMEDRVSRGMFFKADTPSDPNYSDGKPARLQREDNKLFSGNDSRVDDVVGVDNLDDNALWRFIPENYGPGEATPADIPNSCKRDQFVNSTNDYYTDITDNPDLDTQVATFLDGLSTRDQVVALLNRCFTHYKGDAWDGTPVGSIIFLDSEGNNLGGEPVDGCGGDACDAAVFAYDSDPTEDPNIFDIQYTSRFGYVPQIADFPSGSSQKRSFQLFRAVYIQRLVLETSGSDYHFDPGFGDAFYGGYSDDSDDFQDTTSYQRVGEVLVFVFPPGMLPGRLADEDAPFDLGVNRFPELIR